MGSAQASTPPPSTCPALLEIGATVFPASCVTVRFPPGQCDGIVFPRAEATLTCLSHTLRDLAHGRCSRKLRQWPGLSWRDIFIAFPPADSVSPSPSFVLLRDASVWRSSVTHCLPYQALCSEISSCKQLTSQQAKSKQTPASSQKERFLLLFDIQTWASAEDFWHRRYCLWMPCGQLWVLPKQAQVRVHQSVSLGLCLHLCSGFVETGGPLFLQIVGCNDSTS